MSEGGGVVFLLAVVYSYELPGRGRGLRVKVMLRERSRARVEVKVVRESICLPSEPNRD